MNNWKLIIATVVIFGTGVVTGGLLVNYVNQHQSPKKTSRPAPPAPVVTNNPVVRTNNPPVTSIALTEILSKPFLPKLDALLQLSPEQKKAIEKIISDRQGQIKKVTADARNDIRGQLKADQKKQFDELMKWPAKKPASLTNAPVAPLAESLPKISEPIAPALAEVTNAAAALTNAP